jgi:hypothetical protein
MRQRGIQSRRDRPGLDGGTFGAPLGSGGGRDRLWPTVAMIAIVIATAGWTTVAVLALSGRASDASPSPALGGGAAAAASASASDDTGIEPDASDSPIPESHISPALEALLPKTWDGNPLASQSVSGDTLLSDDDWSNVFSTFLASIGKTPPDLIFAQAYDPTGTIDLIVGAYQVSGASAADVGKTLVNAWKASYPGLTTKSETIGGKKVDHAVIPDAGVDGYWYQHADVVYEIETSDATTAGKVLASLP